MISEALVNVDLWCWKPIEKYKSMLDLQIVSTTALGAKGEEPAHSVAITANSQRKQRRRQMFCSLQILAQLPVFICANARPWDCARGLFAWFISVLEKNSTIILLIKTMVINDKNNSLKLNSAVKPLTRQHNRCDWASNGSQSKVVVFFQVL